MRITISKKIAPILLLMFGLILGACGGGAEATATLPPALDEDRVSEAVGIDELYSSVTDSTDGEELFTLLCTKCHGLGGLGNGPSVASLSTQAGMNLTALADRSDEELMTTITEGKGVEMPPWGLILRVEQREALLAYVRTLAP